VRTHSYGADHKCDSGRKLGSFRTYHVETVAFDRDFQRVPGQVGRGEVDRVYRPGQQANTDGLTGEAGAGYASSLFNGDGRGALYDEATLGGESGPLAASVEEGGAPTGPVEGAEAPADVAEQGFQGTPRALPHKDLVENRLGVSLDGIQAFTDDKAAASNSKLGAAAYAAGSNIAFSNSNPDPSLVAHEATHVLQQRAGVIGGGGNGVETGGEAAAERVEAAVAGGGSAAGALGIDPRSLGGGNLSGLARKRPSLSTPFSSGMTFSPNGLEIANSYRIWGGRGIRAPIAAVPGLFATVSPEVVVQVAGGVDWTRHAVSASLGVNGLVGLGLAYGDPNLAEIYLNTEAMASGRFQYERERGQGSSTGNQGGARPPATRTPDTWTLDGGIVLTTTFNVGVRLGGGIIDKRFEFGRVEIGRLTGLAWRNGRFDSARVGWQWGPVPQGFFREVSAQIARARQIMRMGTEAAQQAWRGMSNTAGWAYNGAANLYHRLNPFD